MRNIRDHIALVVGFVAATGGAAHASLSDGLVAHWQFDETSGTTAHDLAGGHDGTLYNMSDADWIAGKLGGALDFDGSNDYVELGQFNFGDTFSISAWGYMPSADACRNLKTVIANASGGGTADGFKFWVNRWYASSPPPGGGKVSVPTANGTDPDEAATDDGAFVFGQWNHLVAVVDRANGTAEIYVNGVASATDTTIRTDFAVNQGTRIASTRTGGWYWQGRLDDIRVYDRLLTQADVDALFATGSDTTAPAAPTGLSATAIDANRIDLTWTANSETDLYRYAVYRGTSAGFTADESSLLAFSATNSHSDTGLPGGSTFYYKVTALDDAFNESAVSNEATATTDVDNTPPADPTNLAVSSTGSSRVSLAWDANAEADLSHYNIYRDTSPGIDILTAIPVATAATNSYKDTGLSFTTDYYYVVAAVDLSDNESGASNEVLASTTDGLLGHWKLDDPTGSTAVDSSVNGMDAALINFPADDSQWVHGMDGGALDFDGWDDYVNVPDGFADFTGGLTVALWAYPTAAGNWARFIDFGNGAGVDNIYFGRVDVSTDLRLKVFDGSAGDGDVEAAGALELDKWQYLAATIDASGNAVIYKNGAQVASAATGVPGDVTRTINYIGRSNWVADDYYQGLMDDLRIYDFALSATEVQALYNAMLDATPPATPQNVTATALNPSQIEVAWDLHPDTDGDLNHLNIYRDTTSGFTPGPANLAGTAGALETTFLDKFLASSTDYYYVMTAADHIGNESAASTPEATATTPAGDATAPAAPTGLAAVLVGLTDVDLTWDANTEPDLGHYNVYRDATSGFTPSGANRIAEGVTTNSYSDVALPDGTYYYVVTAVDYSLNESGPSGEASAIIVSLIAHYTFDDELDPGKDSSPNGNDATSVGATWSSEAHVGAGALDFNQNRVDLPTGIMNSDTGTAAFWIKTSHDFTDTAIIYYGSAVTGGDGWGGQDEFQVHFGDTDRITVFVEAGDPDVATSSSSTYNDDAWHHVAATWDKAAGSVVLYVDGQEVNSTSHAGNVFDFSGAHILGQPDATRRYYYGLLDDLRLYGRALTADDIFKIYVGVDVKIEAAKDAAEPSDAGTFTVTLSKTFGQDTVVNVLVGGTASPPGAADEDYALTGVTAGTVTIPAGQQTATITVTPLDDTITEGDETVVIDVLPGAAYVPGSPSQATVKIVDDDTPPLAFNLTGPADGFQNVTDTPRLSWEAAPRATSYTVVVATDESMANEVFSQDVGDVTTFTPDAGDLAYDAEYYWKVTAHNAIGDTDSEGASWSFVTSKIGAPTVQWTDPRSGEEDVPASTNVKIRFDEPMDPGVVDLFTLSGAGGGDVPGTASFSTNGMVLTFSLTGSLTEGVTYTARLDGAAADRAGNLLEGGELVFSFTTEAPLVGLAIGEGCAAGTGAAGAAILLGLAVFFAASRRARP